ncbi:uncharacterized protein [Ambystoma mexicanum]|uniref:uncharacterized protein isoform X1 n=1 Tax=Ambystoma mexicanum TaxID=8296 RepID=UPI0037E79B1D
MPVRLAYVIKIIGIFMITGVLAASVWQYSYAMSFFAAPKPNVPHLPAATGVTSGGNSNNEQKRNKVKRSTYSDNKGIDNYVQDSAHVTNNIWYQHMTRIGKQTTEDSCYVCSLIPYAMSASRTFVATEIDEKTAQCIIYLALFQTKGRFQGTVVHMTWKTRDSYPYENNFLKTYLSYHKTSLHAEAFRYITSGPEKGETKKVTLQYLPCDWYATEVPGKQGCWERPLLTITGKVFLGTSWEIGVVGSNMVTKETISTIETHNHRCWTTWIKYVPMLTWVEEDEDPITILPLTAPKVCYQHKGEVDVGYNTNCASVMELPEGGAGTAVIMDHYWACGEKAYHTLPPLWSGVCTMVHVNVPSLVVPKKHVDVAKFPKMDEGDRRRKRSAPLQKEQENRTNSNDTVLNRRKRQGEPLTGNYLWGRSETELTSIPPEHRLFSRAAMFFSSIIHPGLQAYANAKWLQITRWELMMTINSTVNGFNAIKEELRAVRMVALQNRYVLDLLTAMEGGVCAKIGQSCCTFIPANDADNGTLTEAVSQLAQMHSKMMDESNGVNKDKSWFSLLWSWMPSWLSDGLKIIVGCAILAGAALIIIRFWKARKARSTDELLEMVGMHPLMPADDGQHTGVIIHEREKLRTQIIANHLDPPSVKIENPRNPRSYIGRWVYCTPGGTCEYMYWSFEDHVNHYGHLGGITKIWRVRGDNEKDMFVVDKSTRGGTEVGEWKTRLPSFTSRAWPRGSRPRHPPREEFAHLPDDQIPWYRNIRMCPSACPTARTGHADTCGTDQLD